MKHAEMRPQEILDGYRSVWFLAMVLMTWLAGLVSLFLLWRPGIYIFLAGVCALRVVAYLKPGSRVNFYSGVELASELLIVVFALFGPGKNLFRRPAEGTNLTRRSS